MIAFEDLKMGDWVLICGRNMDVPVINFVGQIIFIYHFNEIEVAGPIFYDDYHPIGTCCKPDKDKTLRNFQFIQWNIGYEDILTIYN